MQWSTIPINFGGSLDTKRDSKTVVPGRWLQAVDVVYTAIDQAKKRNGYKALSNVFQVSGNLIAPQMAEEFQGELLTADGGNLNSFSPALGSWLPKGRYVSTDIKRLTVDGERPAAGYADVAVLGNFALYAWSVIGAAGNGFGMPGAGATSYCGVMDITTGKFVLGPTLLATAQTNEEVGGPKCVVLGGTTLAVIYNKWTATPATQLAARIVSFPGGGQVNLGAEIILVAASASANGIFDVVGTGTGAAIAFNAGATINIYTIDTGANITHSTTTAATNAGAPAVHISPDPTTGNLWIYWCSATNGNIMFGIWSPTLAVVLAAQTINTMASINAGGALPQNSVTAMIAISVNQHQQKLFVGGAAVAGQNVGSNVFIDATFQFTVPDSGWPQTIVPILFQNGILPFSRPFVVTGNVGTLLGGSTSYAMFLYAGGTSVANSQNYRQATLFAVQLSPSNAPGFSQYSPLRFGSGVVSTFQTTTKLISPPNVAALSATKFLYAYGQMIQTFKSPNYLDGGGFCNTFSLTVDFNSPRAYRSTQAGKLAILNGGCVHAYDGQSCSEWGFPLFPEITGVNWINVAGGGLVAASIYQWFAIFQWIDAQGNLHQSQPSEVFTGTVAAGQNAAHLYITIPYLSQKTLVGVAVFRSPATGGGQGTAFFQVSDPAFPLVQQGSQAYVELFDGTSDAQMQSALLPYTSPISPILTNTAPAPSIVMGSRDKRLYFVNAENPSEEWYTKKYNPGNGLAPSAFLLNELDPKFGDITACAEMDEKLVNFTTKAPYIQTGDGADDTGANSTLTEPQLVPSDVSCDNQKSVILTPNGLQFHSPNGIYILSRALSIAYNGMDVEAFNGQVITSSLMIPNLSQIRFLSSSGMTLVYDYIFEKWSTFSNHTGLGAAIWQGSYCYVTGAQVLQETAGWYLDVAAPIAPFLVSSWLNMAGVQGFQRARFLAMLGDYINGLSANHGYQVSAAYDFNAVYSNLPAVLFGNASTGGQYQFRERLIQQKFDTISLKIQEITTGDSAEFVGFTNMSFEALLKKGLIKIPTSQMA